MSFLLPEAGLLFWMLLAFGVVFLVLYKYGFPVITSMIDERKKFIDDALQNAKEANERLVEIQQRCDELLSNAHIEQARIMHETVVMREKLMGEAREKAHEEGERILHEARGVIAMEKEDALRAIRTEVAELSLTIAEKIIRKQLNGTELQQEYIDKLVDDALKEKSSPQ